MESKSDVAKSDLARLQEIIKDRGVKFVDLRFTGTHGTLNHICRPAETIDLSCLEYGVPFDGSSVRGWGVVQNSDMLLRPDVDTAYVDPFTSQPTLNVICNVFDPLSGNFYSKDPRAAAMRAVKHLRESGIGDSVCSGLEVEFFIFDTVRFEIRDDSAFFEVKSTESKSSTAQEYEYGNSGHIPHPKSGYGLVPPLDSLNDLRSEILSTLSSVGIQPLIQHHEVAASQCEIGFRHGDLLTTSDRMQKVKYIVRNVAASYGKTATFMPKPIVNDNGNGMHCHHSIWDKNGINLFHDSGDMHGISKLCRFYIGGIIKHGRAIAAFTNPTINSYKRLLPGYEAPTVLAYSPLNRSAAVRIPYFTSDTGKDARIEIRFPDTSANPYLCNMAILMAGIDGIKNRIDPGACKDINFYSFTSTESNEFDMMPSSLCEAINSLDNDKEFLTQGGVLSDDYINDYIRMKRREITEYSGHISPWEYYQYYSC